MPDVNFTNAIYTDEWLPSIEHINSRYWDFINYRISDVNFSEKEVLKVISQNDVTVVKEIRNLLSMDSSKFSVYRNRLMDKGLINGSEYGKVKLVLPRFKEFVLMHRYEDL